MASLNLSSRCKVPSQARATRRNAVIVPFASACSTSAPSQQQFKSAPCLPQRSNRRLAVCKAAGLEQAQKANDDIEVDWIPVCLPEELPKGVRKEVEIDGAQVLLFWYRNQIYCIQARSPAEGAYSEGFIKAKFTQDFCIECPSTGSLFSLKDGGVVSWYPNNPVLAAVTPKDTCQPLEIYPVKLAQDAIYVDVSRAQYARRILAKGGSDTSIDNNNVFTVQPAVYFEGMDPTQETASLLMEKTVKDTKVNPVIAVTTVFGLAALAVAGVAVFIYFTR